VTLRKRCREYASEYVEKQKAQFERLGVRGDWDHPYLTMSREFEAAIVRTFGELVERGFVYRGLKPVYWCTTDETALADAEIEYVEGKRDPSIYVRFALKSDPHGVFEGAPADKCYTIIWTTTPWTIPANLAVAVSPTFEYVVAQTGAGDRYVVAEALLKPTMEAAGVADYEIVRRLPGVT
jgi:isoleucyl-tRNA synthetase